MAKALRLDTARMAADFTDHMTVCIDELLDEYQEEVRAALQSPSAQEDIQRRELDEPERGLLCRQLMGGVLAVLDSFGTGSQMDTGNPALAEYIAGALYNPARGQYPGAPITGRPAGPYINIFDKQKTSTGRMAGVVLEGAEGLGAREPSFAFQNADRWFWETDRVQKKVARAAADFWAGVRAEPGRYMRFG